MKILITGAAGMVGNAFIDFLEDKNVEIIATYHKKNIEKQVAGIEYEQINFMNLESVKNLIIEKKPTHILHLAAQSSVGLSWQIPANTITDNLSTFTNLLEAVKCADINCKVLLASSAEVYAFCSKNVSENDTLQAHNAYALSRILQEEIADFYKINFGLDVIIARSFNHISALQNNNFVIPTFINQIIEKVINGEKEILLQVGNIEVVRDFLNVQDVCNAYWQLLSLQNAKPVYNVCSGIGTSLVQVLNFLEEIANLKINTQIDLNKLRKNDNLYLVGNNNLLKMDTNWQQTISIQQSLAYIYKTKFDNFIK